MKLAVIYESVTGNTKQAAEWIAQGMNAVTGAEAAAFRIGETDEAFVREARGREARRRVCDRAVYPRRRGNGNSVHPCK